jgi:hypothetical protein
MSGAPSWCFFYPHGSCVLSDLAYVQDLCPTTGKWRQDSAAKTMRQPQPHNPRPSNDAERLGCHRGIFHHRGSGYTSRLGGFEGNTTLLRAKGTRHVGKKYATTPAGHHKAARRLRNHARLDKKILGCKTWLKRLGCWAETRVRVSARWRKRGGKNWNDLERLTRGSPKPPEAPHLTPAPPHDTPPRTWTTCHFPARACEPYSRPKTGKTRREKYVTTPAVHPEAARGPPDHPRPPHPRAGARLGRKWPNLGEPYALTSPRTQGNHGPRREPPRRSPPGEATTDDPAPAAPTPRRTGPRQARHEQDEAGTEGQAKGMKGPKIASPAKRAKNCESRQFLGLGLGLGLG